MRETSSIILLSQDTLHPTMVSWFQGHVSVIFPMQWPVHATFTGLSKHTSHAHWAKSSCFSSLWQKERLNNHPRLDIGSQPWLGVLYPVVLQQGHLQPAEYIQNFYKYSSCTSTYLHGSLHGAGAADWYTLALRPKALLVTNIGKKTDMSVIAMIRATAT